MGTITGQTLADNAAGLIHDTSRIRWTDTDWLQWLNDAQRAAVLLKPEAHVVNDAVLLTPSVTRQTLPAGGVQFVSLLRNLGVDGATPGSVIRVAARDSLDAVAPDWHTEAATGKVNNFVFDPRDPLHFYIYPKAPDTAWYVELVYSSIPGEMSALSETIDLEDVYANVLVSYMLYRAYLRDAEYAQNAELAMMALASFQTELTGKSQADLTRNPNLTTAPPSPSPVAAAGKPA